MGASPPPHDEDAERAFVGAMIGHTSSAAVPVAVELVAEGDLYVPAHRYVYAAAVQVHASGIKPDPITVADQLRHDALLDRVGGLSALVSLQVAGVATSSLKGYAAIISDYARRRAWLTSAYELQQAASSGDDLAAAAALEKARDASVTGNRRQLRLIRVSSVNLERTEWAWQGRIPLRAITLLVGREGQGKTTALTDLLARLTRGQLEGDFFGTPVDVVYVTAEDSLSATVGPRLLAAGADLDRVHFVEIEVGGFNMGLTLPTDVDRLSVVMRATGAKGLALDPLVAHLPTALDAHKDQHVRTALAPLARFADSERAAVIGVAHFNKGVSTEVLDRVGGSRGFTAAVRSVLAVGEDPDDQAARLLVLAKANLGRLDVPAKRFRVEGREVPAPDGGPPISTSGITWLKDVENVDPRSVLSSGGDEERSATSDAEVWLAELLKDGEVKAVDALRLAGQHGISERTLARARKNIGATTRRDGFGHGAVYWWSLPAESPPEPQCVPKEGMDASANGTANMGMDGEHDGLDLVGAAFPGAEEEW